MDGPPSDAVRQLAEQSVAGTDPAMLADLAGQVLEEVRFEPDFEVEPRLLEVFRRAPGSGPGGHARHGSRRPGPG